MQPVPAAEVCSGQGRANLPDPPCGGVPEPTPQLGPAPHTLRPAQEVHTPQTTVVHMYTTVHTDAHVAEVPIAVACGGINSGRRKDN